MIWILQPKAVSHIDVQEQLLAVYSKAVVFIKGILEVIQSACRESLNLSLTFALSEETCLTENISAKYSLLKRVLSYNSGTDKEMLLTEKNLNDGWFEQEIGGRSNQEEAYKEIRTIQPKLKKIDALAFLLEGGNQKEFYKMLYEITKGLKSIKSMNYNPAQEVYFSIALMFLSYINKWNSTGKVAFKISLRELTRIDEHQTWSEAVDYLNRLAAAIFEIQNSEQEKRTSDTIATVKQYIKDNIHEELSLVRLAEYVYFNPSYLSRLFKQATGSNISDYVSSVRVKKAKRLLENENLKIREVAEAVGYISPTNFARFFKAETNLTPLEYRDGFLTGKQMNEM